MNATEEYSAVITAKKSNAPVVNAKKKIMKVKAATNTKTGNPTYVKMVTAAITGAKGKEGILTPSHSEIYNGQVQGNRQTK